MSFAWHFNIIYLRSGHTKHVLRHNYFNHCLRTYHCRIFVERFGAVAVQFLSLKCLNLFIYDNWRIEYINHCSSAWLPICSHKIIHSSKVSLCYIRKLVVCDACCKQNYIAWKRNKKLFKMKAVLCQTIYNEGTFTSIILRVPRQISCSLILSIAKDRPDNL